MTVHSGWYMKKLCNVSTITREWVALQSIRRLPFLSDMLTAKVGEKRAQSLIIPPNMKASMERVYNGSQASLGNSPPSAFPAAFKQSRIRGTATPEPAERCDELLML